MPKGHKESICQCGVCRAKRGERKDFAYDEMYGIKRAKEINQKKSTSTKETMNQPKMREKLREVQNRPEVKEKKSKARKNKTYEEIYSKEEARRQRELRKEEGKQRMSDLGSEHPLLSQESKIKQGKTRRELWRTFDYRKNQTMVITEAMNRPGVREKLSKIQKGKVGPLAPNWQDGISFEPYGPEFNNELKLYIRQRDNFTCQLCGAIENGRAFGPHHADYNKKNNRERNLILLCTGCNSKVNGNRGKWELCFEVLQEIRL